jgi:putative radical SAM enzyme (TIGR03279 family)
MPKRGLKILEVESGSVAEETGLAPGDRILLVNGYDIPDELALKFYLSEECVDLLVLKKNGTEEEIEIDLSAGQTLGVSVEEFRTRTCNNACLFCFVDQLPPGVRCELQIKDDDYRLSFLHGNYVTLTNLNEKDLDRIIEHRLSPLYVSVHASDPVLRARMLGRRKTGDLDGKLDRLIAGGIRIHAQIVLMPGINDGDHLKKTVYDLYGRYPGIQSIAIVPLGLSGHGTMKDRFLPVTPVFSRELVAATRSWQKQFRSEIGRTFAYLADEFYIQSGTDLPGTSYYDDFGQIEDGVGMARNFLDEFEIELRRRPKSHLALSGTLSTGKLFFSILRDCIKRFNLKFGSSLRVFEVENRFMGRNITVAGLLGGQDFLSALKDRDIGSFLIIPQEALSRVDGIMVDNLTPDDLSKELGKPVYPSGRTVYDFFQLLFRLGRQRAVDSRQ